MALISTCPSIIVAGVKARLGDDSKFFNLHDVRGSQWTYKINSDAEEIKLTLNGQTYQYSTARLINNAFTLWINTAREMGLTQEISLTDIGSGQSYFSVQVDNSGGQHPLAVTLATYPNYRTFPNYLRFYSAKITNDIQKAYRECLSESIVDPNMTISDFGRLYLSIITTHEMGHLFSLGHPDATFYRQPEGRSAVRRAYANILVE